MRCEAAIQNEIESISVRMMRGGKESASLSKRDELRGLRLCLQSKTKMGGSIKKWKGCVNTHVFIRCMPQVGVYQWVGQILYASIIYF